MQLGVIVSEEMTLIKKKKEVLHLGPVYTSALVQRAFICGVQ